MKPDERMVYVAADPAQPGEAWAICVDDPRWAKETAESIAEWVKDGANVLRVTKEIGVAMLEKWERPHKQESLL